MHNLSSGDNCRWKYCHVELGAGAKVLHIVTIGNHCKMGINAVVEEDMPDYLTCVMLTPRIIIRK